MASNYSGWFSRNHVILRSLTLEHAQLSLLGRACSTCIPCFSCKVSRLINQTGHLSERTITVKKKNKTKNPLRHAKHIFLGKQHMDKSTREKAITISMELLGRILCIHSTTDHERKQCQFPRLRISKCCFQTSWLNFSCPS